jgi:hypothetical protein
LVIHESIFLDNIERIANALGIPVYELLTPGSGD